MNDSLSIILPLCDAEANLAGQVSRLFDVLPDLTGHFEIVLVDDASADQTLDLARELAAQYPQVRVIRHRDRLGIAAAVRTGLQFARGSTVFVHDDPATLSARDLRRLWRERDRQELVVAAAGARPPVFDQHLLERLAAWGQSLHDAEATTGGAGGSFMIRRGAIGRLLADESIDEASTIATQEVATTRADSSHASRAPRQATTFLRHLRILALGE